MVQLWQQAVGYCRVAYRYNGRVAFTYVWSMHSYKTWLSEHSMLY